MIMTQAGRVWVFDVQSEGGGCPRPRHLCTDSLTIDSTWFWGQRRRQTLGTMWKNPLCVSVPYKHTYIHTYLYIYIPHSLSLTSYLSPPLANVVCGWLHATCRLDAVGTAGAPCHLCHTLQQQPPPPGAHTYTHHLHLGLWESMLGEKNTQRSHCPPSRSVAHLTELFWHPVATKHSIHVRSISENLLFDRFKK